MRSEAGVVSARQAAASSSVTVIPRDYSKPGLRCQMEKHSALAKLTQAR